MQTEKASFRKVSFKLGLGITIISNRKGTQFPLTFNLPFLITFLTTGEDETRAWTIKKNSTAPIAGTAIHTDFKDKFIRADVINWQSLLDSGSHANAKAKGLVRTEGKDYIVKDGDVIEFLHS